MPLVRADAFGLAQFIFNKDFTRLCFKLVFNDIENLTVAYIHLGMRGENGPAIVFLFGTVTGTITEDDLVGPLQGMSLLELAKEMKISVT